MRSYIVWPKMLMMSLGIANTNRCSEKVNKSSLEHSQNRASGSAALDGSKCSGTHKSRARLAVVSESDAARRSLDHQVTIIGTSISITSISSH